MQKEQAASIAAAEIMAMRQATAHKWGEEEAAALQHLKSEHGAFRIKVGHFCGYSDAPQVGGTRGGFSGMSFGVPLGDHDCGRG
jgi:DNA repair ATPase RecN